MTSRLDIPLFFSPPSLSLCSSPKIPFPFAFHNLYYHLLLFIGLFHARHIESLHIGSRREDALTAVLSGPESAAAGAKRQRRRFGAGSFLRLCLRLHPHLHLHLLLHLHLRLPSPLRRLHLRQAAPGPSSDELTCLACPVDRRRAGAGALWVG